MTALLLAYWRANDEAAATLRNLILSRRRFQDSWRMRICHHLCCILRRSFFRVHFSCCVSLLLDFLRIHNGCIVRESLLDTCVVLIWGMREFCRSDVMLRGHQKDVINLILIHQLKKLSDERTNMYTITQLVHWFAALTGEMVKQLSPFWGRPNLY